MPTKVEHGPNRSALETTLASDPRLSSDKHAALVALCRITAEQIDDAGSTVSTRLIASYLSALKDVERVLAGRPTAAQGEKGAGSGALGRLQSVATGETA